MKSLCVFLPSLTFKNVIAKKIIVRYFKGAIFQVDEFQLKKGNINVNISAGIGRHNIARGMENTAMIFLLSVMGEISSKGPA